MYDLISENSESTVVTEYQPTLRTETTYQTEADLERAFIAQLQAQAYEYLPIKSENDLIANLRKQLELLNDYRFSDAEWEQFFNSKIANRNYGIEEKTAIIQEDYIQLLQCDDGSVKNIYLIDKDNIHNNRLQVINQYEALDGQRPNRYDVTILVNGLPLVHVELKKRGVHLKEAFNQIERYSRESFWSGTGLFEYVQLFVISNGTYTKYYSNTTRYTHIKEREGKPAVTGKRTSNSFEFTSWWADAANRPITDLMDFTRTFFAKHTLLNMLTKYCVFTSDKLLLVMRPYQIVATERILGKINVANNYKIFNSPRAGGYIWHTTGSGKTLTSFKTALLASKLPYIDKVLFVVDRKDLDYQTMKEYDRFKKGRPTQYQYGHPEKTARRSRRAYHHYHYSKIVDTGQKHKNLPAFSRHCVIIFDECHRSQFGEMHAAITKSFKKYHLFGFTGTPILAKNLAGNAIRPDLMTTDQVFGERLHTYTVVDAIRDKNVLPFRVDYVSTMREQDNILDAKVWDIDRERILLAPERIGKIVTYILEHFDQKTKRNSFYRLKERRLAGFNSILATASIEAAKRYYAEFKRQMADLPSDKQLKVALIYSFGVNEDEPEAEGFIGEENPEDTSRPRSVFARFPGSCHQGL